MPSGGSQTIFQVIRQLERQCAHADNLPAPPPGGKPGPGPCPVQMAGHSSSGRSNAGERRSAIGIGRVGTPGACCARGRCSLHASRCSLAAAPFPSPPLEERGRERRSSFSASTSDLLVRQPAASRTAASRMVMGLLSPALSSKGGEGESLARCSRPPDACKVQFRSPRSVLGGWLPDMDLNHDKQIQSLLCYRYTIGQAGAVINLEIFHQESSC